MGKRENNLAFLKSVHHQFGLPMSHELVVDNFAGGGGASFGIEMAIGRSVDIAINHDPEAVALHEANHPSTRHFCESVWDVDPVEATAGRPVGLAWFSPDCKHFSKAKGGKPVEKKIRGLAWVVIRWAAKVKPRVIILENVEEFQTWGPLTSDNMPCPKRKGQTFRKWVDALRLLGYQVEWRELRACDYGAPTIRKRLFLIARCDGKPIVWPAPTHGNGKGMKPYLTAADCIDWSIPCPSIFERSRPLAENTLKRIARGIQRYVIEANKPFIVSTAHSKTTGRGPNVWPTDEPLRTVTSSNDKYLVAPHMVGIDHKSSGASCAWNIEQPITTVTAEARHAVVASTLIQTGYGEREGQAPRVPGIDKPLGTVVACGQKHALVSAFIAKHYGGPNNEKMAGAPADEPFPTITARGTQNQVVTAHIQRDFGASIGASADEPLGTVTAGGSGKSALVTSNLLKLRGTCKDGQAIKEPMPTVTAGGMHIGEVRAFLVKYYGTGGQWQDLADPMHTIPSRDRMGLVMVDGEQYQIADIGMRMLMPRELYRAQGFPDSYKIEITYKGKPLSKTAQVRMCGNSVSPVMARALVAANYLDQAEAIPSIKLEIA